MISLTAIVVALGLGWAVRALWKFVATRLAASPVRVVPVQGPVR